MLLPKILLPKLTGYLPVRALKKWEEAGMSVARMKRIGRFVRLATIYGISFSHHAQMRGGVRVLEAGKHSRDLTRHLSSPLKIVDLVFLLVQKSFRLTYRRYPFRQNMM